MNKIVYICLLLIFTSCNSIKYGKEEITLTIINEMQPCEEDNLHYRIIKAEPNKAQSLVGMSILPTFAKAIESSDNYDLFFPSPTIKRIEFKVRGYYSLEQHNEYSVGCPGTHYFKIVDILDQREIEATYPIDNQ